MSEERRGKEKSVSVSLKRDLKTGELSPWSVDCHENTQTILYMFNFLSNFEILNIN